MSTQAGLKVDIDLKSAAAEVATLVKALDAATKSYQDATKAHNDYMSAVKTGGAPGGYGGGAPGGGSGGSGSGGHNLPKTPPNPNANNPEEQYQKRLGRRVESMATAKRMGEDLYNMGLAPAPKHMIPPTSPKTEEQKYQDTLNSRWKNHQQSKRLHKDLVRMGVVQEKPVKPMLTAEEKYQEQLSRRQSSIETNNRMRTDLVASGHMEDRDKKIISDPKGGGKGGDDSSDLRKYGRIAAAAVMVDQAFKFAARSAESFTNSTMTASQQMESFGEGIPVLGSILKSAKQTWESLSGVTDSIRHNDLKMELQSSLIPVKGANERAIRDANYEAGAAGAVSKATSSIPYASFQSINRGSYYGQMQAQERDIRLAASDQYTRASRDVAAAGANVNSATGNVGEQSERLRKAIADRDLNNNATSRFRKEETGWTRNKGLIDTTTTNAMLAAKRVQEEQNGLERENLRLKEAKLALIEAEGRQRKAVIEGQKAELSILQGRESRASSLQTTMGSMMPSDRGMAINAAKNLRDKGIGGISKWEADIAGQLFPDFVNKEREKLGGQMMPGLREQLGADFVNKATGGAFSDQNTLEGIRAAQDQKVTDIRIAVQMDEEAIAKKVASTLDESVKALIKALEVKFENTKKGVEAGQSRTQNNNP